MYKGFYLWSLYKKEEGGRKERKVKVSRTERKRGYQSINQSAHLESEAKKERKKEHNALCSL